MQLRRSIGQYAWWLGASCPGFGLTRGVLLVPSLVPYALTLENGMVGATITVTAARPRLPSTHGRPIRSRVLYQAILGIGRRASGVQASGSRPADVALRWSATFTERTEMP